MKLNFGCGTDIKEGYYNIDIIDSKGVDKVFDFEIFPYPLDGMKFDYIILDNVLEHLSKPQKVLEELWKFCNPDAIIEIIVPYANSRSAYASLQHVFYFNDKTFTNFYADWRERKFIVEEQIVNVQRFLTWLPRRITNILAVFFMNINVSLNVKLKVMKCEIIKSMGI